MLVHERKLIEDNIKMIECTVKCIMKKYYIPYDEYEDYLQMGFLKLCETVHRYNGSTAFKTFVVNIIENSFIDMYRKKRDMKLESLDEKLYADDENKDELIDMITAPGNMENKALANITAEALKLQYNRVKKNCTAKTTVKGFEALELKIQGYKATEIAAMFDAPANSIRCWMSKARQALLADSGIKDLLADEI